MPESNEVEWHKVQVDAREDLLDMTGKDRLVKLVNNGMNVLQASSI